MAAILGSEIDKLVLGYLQDKNLKKASEAFCKTSPHLREEYELLKRGLTPRRITDFKLIEVLKEYSEIRAIVSDYIDAERNVSSSSELSRLRSLKEKVQYLCRPSQTPPPPSTQQPPSKETKNRRKLLAVPLKRRRPSSTAGSDEDESSSSPQATQIKDLPGYCQSTASKRRKLFDKNLVITNGPDVEPQSPTFTSEEDGDASKSIQENNNEVARPSTSHAMSAKKRDLDAPSTNRPSTSFKQTSAMTADPTVPFEIFSETILENQEFQNLLVANINTSGIVDRVQSNEGNDGTLERQLEQAMENIIKTTEEHPIFDDIVQEALHTVGTPFWQGDEGQMSSSTPNKSSETEMVSDEVIDAQPIVVVPNESIKQRLRPRKTPTIDLTASTKKKMKKMDKKIEVLSEVRSYPNEQLEAMVQTQQESQFQSQPQAQQQPTTVFYCYMDDTGQQCWVPVTNVAECDQAQSVPTSSSNVNFTILPDGTVCIPSIISSSTASSLDPGTILNTTDPQNAIVVHDNSIQNMPTEEPSSSCLEENRIIVIDGNEVNAEAQKMPTSQIPINPFPAIVPTSGMAEQAPVSNTPAQPIQSNIAAASMSSTTPRHKISHVRVLDFTTPARTKFIDPATATYTGGLDVLNSSRMAANETPQNRTIISTVPNSAPPKIDSTKSESVAPPILHTETSSSMDTVIHVDVDGEDTVISVGSETPKVRKRHRKACVRTLSTHKEVNEEVAAKRLKRLEKTKKKIDPDEDGNSNEGGGSGQGNAFKAISEEKMKEGEKSATTEDDALREWQLSQAARNNPALFEQLLREKNSKMQAEKDSANMGKRRTNRNARTKKKPAATAPTPAAKSTNISVNEGEVVVANETLNSSIESGCNESNTSLQTHAQMLENNLKSAKKVSPEKKVAATKTKPKNSKKEIYIKLPESPKVRALKRRKSSTKLKASTSEVSSTTEQQTENSQPPQPEEVLPTEPPPPSSPKPNADEPMTRMNTSDDLEVAQDLLQLNETIIQNEKQQSARKVMASQSDCTSTVTTATNVDTIVRIPIASTTEHVQRNASMSLSALLETPMKLDALAQFPKTPGMHMPPQLTTPMLRTVTANPMDDSIMKNPDFPTPNFPITPGSILTPCRESMTSPRSDQETVFGAANRPTDYSSSSSYYKPDESDGVDKQLQALLRASRQYSSAQSADEMIDENTEMSAPNASQTDANANEDQSNERLNYSGSSSSSSSSSSSDDSDSDSSDSSSNSSLSHMTQASMNIDEYVETVTVVTSVHEEPETETPLPDTESIKSHIQSLPLSTEMKSFFTQPDQLAEIAEREQRAEIAEKRLRMQEFCRKESMAKVTAKFKPKTRVTKWSSKLCEARQSMSQVPAVVKTQKLLKLRELASKRKPSASDEMKDEPIESGSANDVPPTASKPEEKRCSGDNAIQNHLVNPLPVVADVESTSKSHIESTAISKPAQVVNNEAKQTHSKSRIRSHFDSKTRNSKVDAVKPSTSNEMKREPIDSGNVNDVKPNASQPMSSSRSGDEESIDAIQNHLASDISKMTNVAKEPALPTPPTPVVPSPENLIEILEDKCNTLSKRSPSVKTTKQIEPLPLRKIGTRSTKTQNEAKTAASSTTKTQATSKSKSKASASRTAKKESPPPVASTSKKPGDGQGELLSKKESNPKERPESPVPETPIKERRANQLFSIFGEISDIETPVKKSPVKASSVVEPVAPSNSDEVGTKEPCPPLPPPAMINEPPPPPPPPAMMKEPPPPTKDPSPSKENLVTSTTSSDQSESRIDNSSARTNESNETSDSDSGSDNDDDDDSDDYLPTLEKCIPSHIEHIVSNNNESPKTAFTTQHTFKTIRLVISERTVQFSVSAEKELYRSAEPQLDEPSSSTFGRPLLTSTPSGQKSKATGVYPKFNLKHKDHAPTSMPNDETTAAKATASNINKSKKDPEINRKDLNVNEILGYLHPEDTKIKH